MGPDYQVYRMMSGFFVRVQGHLLLSLKWFSPKSSSFKILQDFHSLFEDFQDFFSLTMYFGTIRSKSMYKKYVAAHLIM